MVKNERQASIFHSALADLELDSLDVVHAGEHAYPLTDRIRAVPLARLHKDVKPLR